jgi:lipase chaperone LimK
MTAAFSTPFWIAVAGVTSLAMGVSHLAQPTANADAGTSAHTLAAIERNTARLADVAVPPQDDERPTIDRSEPGTRQPVSPFTVDSLGRLVVSASTVAVLDSWLASIGRGQPLAALEPRLRAELPTLAAERAFSLLRHHAAYREDERELLRLLQAQQPPVSQREQLDRTMALRRRHFDSVSVQELFGVQEARGLYASEASRILADTTLSEAQQAQRLLALRMSLPPEVAAQEFGGSEFSFAMEKQVAEMRARGENDAEVTFLRKQFVDVEGARSVLEVENEQLQVQRQAWELRHPTFVRERDQLINADIAPEDKQRQLAALLRQNFRPDAIATARAYSGL